MTIDKTTIPFLREDCIKEFGAEQGELLYRNAERIYQELLDQTDDKGNEIVREHLQGKLFPPIAYYKALLAGGYSKDDAIAYVKKETHKAATVRKEEMQGLAKMPFAYTVYRMGVKKHMKKNFPDEGWETEWVCCNRKEIHFNLHRCIYWDMTNLHKCPELCCVYCENDDIAFSGLLPKIRFQRSGTLGNGSSCCDFHFMKA